MHILSSRVRTGKKIESTIAILPELEFVQYKIEATIVTLQCVPELELIRCKI